MNQSYIELAKRKPKLIRAMVFGYTFFNAIWMFPIRFTLHWGSFWLNALILYVFFLFGAFLVGLYPERVDRAIFALFVMQGLGLGVRAAMEWGETTFMGDLTTANVALHMVLVPGLVALSYRLHKAKNHLS